MPDVDWRKSDVDYWRQRATELQRDIAEIKRRRNARLIGAAFGLALGLATRLVW